MPEWKPSPSLESEAPNPAVKTRIGTAAFSLQSSASAGVVDKRLEVVEDVEMMVSNDITAILGHTR